MKIHHMTIRTNILSYFLFIVGIVALSLIGVQYYFSKVIALEATDKTFDQTAEKIAFEIKSRDFHAKSLLYKMERSADIAPPTAAGLPPREKLKSFTELLLLHEKIYSNYIGYPDGALFEIVNMESSDQLHHHFKAPPATRWTVIKVYEENHNWVKESVFLDKNLRFLASRSEPTDYRANRRPWYLQALKTGEAVRSDPYLFSHLGQNGITYSKIIPDTGRVLGIDLTLASLHEVLARYKFSPSSEIFWFNSDGSVISSSVTAESTTNAAMATILRNGDLDKVVTLETDGQDRFMMVVPLVSESQSVTYIGISVSLAEILPPYIKKILYSTAVALQQVLCAIPLIFFATASIVRTLRALMIENEKIKNREFEHVGAVDTDIIELLELSNSQVSMSESIRDYQYQQKNLLDSFIKLIASAIDAKSAYTGAHCKRVPVLATLLARKANDVKEGALKDFYLGTAEQWEEFERGAWLHDCGKITTPEHVVDKATRLEMIYDRIHEIRTRFEVLWRDVQIEYLERRAQGDDQTELDDWRSREQQALRDDFAFIAECNHGDNYMTEEKKERVKSIAQRQWLRYFDNRLGLSDGEQQRYPRDTEDLPVTEPLLGDKPEHMIGRSAAEADYQIQGLKLEIPQFSYNHGEIYNLTIEKGTLTPEERFKINEHVIMTIKMLEQLPFPAELKDIPQIAGSHHETLNGSGYPRRLSEEELSIAGRILAIADIFEALTASDRPYKAPKTLSESLKIMQFMVKDRHIDGELFAIFLRSGIYRDYAVEYLQPEQLDDVNIDDFLT
jgi:HD-GYP domain-containing protein (c-di-GMP phosphodiesterase class II)